jgi:hypothetical protein
VDGLLDPATALIQRIPGEAHQVKRVHHRHGVGQFLGGGGLEAGEPVHRDHLDRLAPGLVAIGQPGLERLLRAAFDHVQQPCGPVPSRIGVRSMITVAYSSPRRVCRQAYSSTPIT